MTGRLSPLDAADPVAHGRQLRSNYVYNAHWVPLDFSDLLSLMWRYDQADADGQAALAAYYRACWVALFRALSLEDTELGHWLAEAPPPVMASLPAFVERQAPFADDLLARAETVANLFSLREAVLEFGVDQVNLFDPAGPSAGIHDERLSQAIDALYFTAIPAQLDELSTLFTPIDELLYELLLAWNPRHSVTLAHLITHFGYPNPDEYRERFSL